MARKCIQALSLLLFSIGSLCGCSDSSKSNTAKPVVAQLSESDAIKSINKQLADNYGLPGATTTWYNNIKSIDVKNHVAYARTDLKQGDAKIAKICGAIYSWHTLAGPSSPLSKIQIYGLDGAQLFDTSKANGSCSM